MIQIILVIHLIIAISLVGVIMLQRSEGGGLGIGGGGSGGGMGGLIGNRATANLLTRATAFLAAAFFVSSITLAIVAGGARAPTSILEGGGAAVEEPAVPAGPRVPEGN